jgi:CDK-activating kinase assembly factor MAT1
MVIAQTSSDDRCPVCKSDKYLNPNLKFLVNPECYHKLYNTFCVRELTFLIRCETCIDRIYTLGPAPCPQCGRVLRKAKFRKQTFEDTLVEREVDVRRRISKLFSLLFMAWLTLGSISDEKTLLPSAHTTITSKK